VGEIWRLDRKRYNRYYDWDKLEELPVLKDFWKYSYFSRTTRWNFKKFGTKIYKKTSNWNMQKNEN